MGRAVGAWLATGRMFSIPANRGGLNAAVFGFRVARSEIACSTGVQTVGGEGASPAAT
jgi:hypothetical protein